MARQLAGGVINEVAALSFTLERAPGLKIIAGKSGKPGLAQLSILQTGARNFMKNCLVVLGGRITLTEAGKRYQFANKYPLVTLNQ